jgi:Cu-Zn family superoxide dismutase
MSHNKNNYDKNNYDKNNYNKNYKKQYYKYKNKYINTNTNNINNNINTNIKGIASIISCNNTNNINNNTNNINNNTNNIMGTIHFEQINNMVRIYGNVTGLEAGKHGFHIHESANLMHCCSSLKGHYNPLNSVHGGPSSENRHVGDLGNIVSNLDKVANIDFTDHLIKLNGPYSIIGRSLVIHANEDDLGMGTNPDSLITGNSGERIAYGIIGLDT